MSSDSFSLSRREREIMDIIYARGEASAADVEEALTKAPSYSTVRTLLGILETKGHLRHRREGSRYIYAPIESRAKASRSALKRIMNTFFEGSLANAVAAFVETRRLSPTELKRIEQIIQNAKNSNG